MSLIQQKQLNLFKGQIFEFAYTIGDDLNAALGNRKGDGDDDKEGVFTKVEHNRVAIIYKDNKKKPITEDGHVIYGRLTGTTGSWGLDYFYHDGTSEKAVSLEGGRLPGDEAPEGQAPQEASGPVVVGVSSDTQLVPGKIYNIFPGQTPKLFRPTEANPKVKAFYIDATKQEAVLASKDNGNEVALGKGLIYAYYEGDKWLYAKVADGTNRIEFNRITHLSNQGRLSLISGAVFDSVASNGSLDLDLPDEPIPGFEAYVDGTQIKGPVLIKAIHKGGTSDFFLKENGSLSKVEEVILSLKKFKISYEDNKWIAEQVQNIPEVFGAAPEAPAGPSGSELLVFGGECVKVTDANPYAMRHALRAADETEGLVAATPHLSVKHLVLNNITSFPINGLVGLASTDDIISFEINGLDYKDGVERKSSTSIGLKDGTVLPFDLEVGDQIMVVYGSHE